VQTQCVTEKLQAAYSRGLEREFPVPGGARHGQKKI
jgi:hypothetical protein